MGATAVYWLILKALSLVFIIIMWFSRLPGGGAGEGDMCAGPGSGPSLHECRQCQGRPAGHHAAPGSRSLGGQTRRAPRTQVPARC